jgi:glycerol-3-phosphate responsive antiterminator
MMGPACPICREILEKLIPESQAKDAEITRCHDAICCLTGEVERLTDVIRELRAQAREVELCDIALLEGFAWTAETAAFLRQEWDRETERIIGGTE